MQQSLLINKSGNISIIALMIMNIMFFQIVFVNSIFLENKYYMSDQYQGYNSFILENLITTMIYDDYKNVSLNSSNLQISSINKNENNNTSIEITVIINKNKIIYNSLYDQECNVILEFYQQEKSQV